MRILLIDPGSKKLGGSIPHVGLGYIAAALERDGNEVVVLHLDLHQGSKVTKVMNSDFDVIGVTATSFTFRRAVAALEKAKAVNRKAKTVIGGPHTTIALETLLHQAEVDYLVYGEGEVTMQELTWVLKENPHPSGDQLAGIKGLVFRRNGDVVINPPRPWVTNLDELPFPAFHLFDMRKYLAYPLLSSRGCPFRCIYCAVGAIWGRIWRARSPGNVIKEIRYAQDRYNWKHKPFHIVDDSFNVNIARALEFCNQLIEEGIEIEWSCYGIRADRVTPELAYKMRKAGCHAVSLGIESASLQVLKNIKKGLTLEDITAGINSLVDAGITVHGSFMIGNPGDNLETCKKSIEFAKRSALCSSVFFLTKPYPKTELWEYVQRQGRLLIPDYTQFHHYSSKPVFDTPDFPGEEREKAYKLATRFYLKQRLKNSPRFFVLRLERLGWRRIGVKTVARAGMGLLRTLIDLLLRREQQV